MSARRMAAFTLLVLLLTTAVPAVAGRTEAKSCGSVVSYSVSTDQSDATVRRFEWRLFDPARGMDELFLRTDQAPSAIQWDSTFQNVFYLCGDSLWTIAWKRGARPHAIGRVPERGDRWDFWRDRTTSGWVLLKILRCDPRIDDMADRCVAELWQGDSQANHWNLVRRDSVDGEGAGPADRWIDGTPIGDRSAMVELSHLEAELAPSARADEALYFDTTTVRVVEPERSDGDWRYLPLQSGRRGVAFRLNADAGLASEPFFLVDLAARKMGRILTGGSTDVWVHVLFAEHCGLLLMPGEFGQWQLFDSDTGRRVHASNTGFVDEAAWVPEPR